jgi:twinkle protein
VLFEDSETRGWCYRCAAVQATDGDTVTSNRTFKPQQSAASDSTLELAAIKNYPIRALEDRGISLATCERFGVRVAVDEATASTVTDHFYPYIVNGEVTGYKKRRLPKQFAAIGKIKGLFGQAQCKANAKFLLVLEGELDAMSAWEMFVAKGKGYNVVSLPNGANENGTLDAATRKELEFFTSHEVVFICLDEDEPGQTTAKALAELLISQCQVKIMRLKRKDTSEYLKAGDIEGWWSCLRGAQDYAPEAIENGAVENIDELLKPAIPGVFVDSLPKTMMKLQGLRRGEITMILAPPGVGKSTLCRQITYDLLTKQDAPVFNIFLEEGKTKTRQGIVALHTGVALNRLRRDPSLVKREDVQYVNDNILTKLELLTNNKVLLNDEALLNKINYFTKAKGCKFGVLDHISYVMSSRDTKDERKEIDQLMTKLATLVEDQGLHLIIVSHIKRKNRDRDKSGKESWPYWELLSLDDARGSGAFEQLAWNIIGIEREVTDPSDETARPKTRTRILKSREEGTLGLGDYLNYDTIRGALVPINGGVEA